MYLTVSDHDGFFFYIIIVLSDIIFDWQCSMNYKIVYILPTIITRTMTSGGCGIIKEL